MALINMKVCKCNRCGHVWLPQNGNIKPIACENVKVRIGIVIENNNIE